MKSFKENWPLDGLNTLEYDLKEVTKEPLLTRIFVDFSRESDKNLGNTPVDIKALVGRHPCLKGLRELEACKA